MRDRSSDAVRDSARETETKMQRNTDTNIQGQRVTQRKTERCTDGGKTEERDEDLTEYMHLVTSEINLIPG